MTGGCGPSRVAMALAVAGCAGGGLELGVPAPPRPDLIPSEPEAPVRLVNVEMSEEVSCTLDETGRARCDGGFAPPGVALRELSIFGEEGCGLRVDDGRAECWGGASSAAATKPPPGELDRIAIGDGFACGLAGASVSCWGEVDDVSVALFEEREAIDLRAGGGVVCAMRTDGSVDCQARGDAGARVEGPVSHIDDGSQAVIVLMEAGDLAALSDRVVVLPQVLPVEPYAALIAVPKGACTLDESLRLACVGDATPPMDEALDLAAGLEDACVIDLEGALQCWMP